MNELLGWGQLLSDAIICDQAHAEFTSAGTSIRCAFADCKRVPRQKREEAEQGKKPRAQRRSQARCQCKNRFGENLSWPNLTPELSRAAERPRQWPNHSCHGPRPRSGLGLNELLDRCQPELLPDHFLSDLSSEPKALFANKPNPETECRRSSRHGVCGEGQTPGRGEGITTQAWPTAC